MLDWMSADSSGLETLPHERRGSGQEKGTRRPQLIVAFDGERPLEPPTRHALVDVDIVVVGRGTKRSHVRKTEGSERQLILHVPDPRMSSTHLRIVPMSDTHLVRDAKSRNGTFVNGTRVDAAPLADGDILEAGQTILLYRTSMEATGDAGPSGIMEAGLATLVPRLADELATLKKLAATTVSVLIQAETGAGKEVLARALHLLSGRAGPYVPVNCGALPPNLVESELFGFRKGAFSGATEDRSGLVRAADGGTLFLDEIGDLPLPSQAALLRVLQEREVVAVGATRPAKVDIRVLAATHRDMDRMVEEGLFRTDLLARIAGHTLTVPPLRERKEDLSILVAELLRRLCGPRAPEIRFTSGAARALFRYDWPLNVRELEKCLETAAALAGDGPIDDVHLPPKVRAAGELTRDSELPQLSEDDRRHRDELLDLLRQNSFNVSAVARKMGKARMQVQRWMRRYHIRTPG
jgi:DNA-binding NtrC family response regulator